MSGTRSTSPRAPVIDRGPDGPALLICSHGARAARVDVSPRLRARALAFGFAEQMACSLYAEPTLEQALDRLRNRPVFLVPMLMSDGVTLEALRQRLAQREDARRVVLCHALGAHSGLAARVAECARDKAVTTGWSPRETALLLIAHGSRRDGASRRSLFRLGAEVQRRGTFAEVRQALLEEEPGVEAALKSVSRRQVVAIGCFAEAGRHALGDVPRLLAGSPLPVIYEGPIGMAPWVEDLILDLAVAGRTGLSRQSAVS